MNFEIKEQEGQKCIPDLNTVKSNWETIEELKRLRDWRANSIGIQLQASH